MLSVPNMRIACIRYTYFILNENGIPNEKRFKISLDEKSQSVILYVSQIKNTVLK